MKKIIISTIIMAIVLLYSYNVYVVNKNCDNLRNYKKEQIGYFFNAFEGKILVKNIRFMDSYNLNKIKNISEFNKKYIDYNKSDFVIVRYVLDNLKDDECLEIKANLDGYIFYDGLPQASRLSENEFEYLIPIPKEKVQNNQNKTIKIFFENIKVNELEHHYVILNL